MGAVPEQSPTDDIDVGLVADPAARADLQRRTIRTLFVGVLPAGAGLGAAISATALLGKEITGNAALGTLAAALLTVGTALATIPVARHMAAHGRRSGMRRAWTVAAAGAGCALAASLTDFYPLLLVGALGIGTGNAATLAARYAAADLAVEHERARSIGLLVWAGSFGSVLGPSIGLGWAGTAAEALGMPELAGPYVLGFVAFALAAVWIERRLHPDPLIAAGGTTRTASTTAGAPSSLPAQLRQTKATLGAIVRHPGARLAMIAMLVGHAVMVGIMTATPLHMEDGAHELQIIGFVISLHIVGMYFFAPVVGMLVDRIGPPTIIAAGGMILFAGAELASHTDAEDSLGVFVGLFLVGLGWSFGLIAGSSLLTSSFSITERVAVQGTADLVMSASGALAALSAGVVFELASYHALSHYAGFGAVALSVLAIWGLIRPTPVRPPAAPG
jgi:MFS family permease